MHQNQLRKKLVRLDEANGFEGLKLVSDRTVTPQGHINWAAFISRHYFTATQLVCLKHDSQLLLLKWEQATMGIVETQWNKKKDTAWLKWTIVKESFVDI